MSRSLNKALRQQKKKTQRTVLTIYGSLGIPLNGQKVVHVEDRNAYVWVRLRDNQNEVIQAFNNKVAPSYDLPVTLHRKGNSYVVDGVNTDRYENNWNNAAPYLPQHGTSHSFAPGGGADITWVFDRQFMPALVYPNSVTGTNVKIWNYPYFSGNVWKYVGGTGTPDLLGYRPITGSSSIMALVYLDAVTGNPGILVNSGSYMPFNVTGNVYSYLPIPTNNQIPLAGVRLSTGTNSIGWDNLYDVRQWIHSIPTGTSSGGGGGGGGSSTPAIPVYDDGQFVITGSYISFNGNLSVGSSGTGAFVTAPITTYLRVAQPIPLSSPTGTFWMVPDRVYASGSLGVFNQGHALIPGIDYEEQLWVSGTYRYLLAQPTGTYHLVYYGVPCAPQIQPPTGTAAPGELTDSDGTLLVDSDGVQLTDSNG